MYLMSKLNLILISKMHHVLFFFSYKCKHFYTSCNTALHCSAECSQTLTDSLDSVIIVHYTTVSLTQSCLSCQ